jgi:polyhydroxyalkanoate synthesis repressor PhaR
MAVLIKRYANRKLYNTETSRYITLKGIAELLNEGEEVRVIDNATGEDITSVALSQILVDSKRSNTSPPNTLMSQIFGRSGDALYDVLKRGVDDATDGIGELQERMRRIVGQEESRRQAEAAGQTEASGDEGTDSDDRRDSRRASNWMGQASPDFEHLVQNAVERVFRLLDLPRRSDITALNRNLDRVASAIETLEKAFARRDSRPPREGPAPPP